MRSWLLPLSLSSLSPSNSETSLSHFLSFPQKPISTHTTHFENDQIMKPTSITSMKKPRSIPDSDLKPTPARRKPGSNRLKRSRPETPLLKWKIDEIGKEKDQNDLEENTQVARRKGRKGKEAPVSARKLAAGLWRLQLPETGAERRSGCQQLGFQPDAGHIEAPFIRQRNGKGFAAEAKDDLRNPSSTSRSGFLRKLSNSVMEGATKWEPVSLKSSEEVRQIYSQMKLLDQQRSAASVVNVLESELEQARARIQELELEQCSSKKKLENFLKNMNEEKVSWRRREHEKIRAFIDDVKVELNRERKIRQRAEKLNSKLVNEIADAKLSAKRYMQEYEKERKARELIEEVCDELAKEIGEDKEEVEALKEESMKLRDEVEDERKMLQMAEVWREERVQMKLVDAKVAVEEKYSMMNKLVADLENFLKSRSPTVDVKEVREGEFLRKAATAVNIQDVNDISYEHANPDDIFSVFEEVNFGEPNEREIEQCVAYSPASHASKIRTVSPEANAIHKKGIQRHTVAYVGENGDIEEDDSGWETVSHLEDQDSSYSPDGSAPSVNKNRRESNVSESGTEWEERNYGEETPTNDISEVCSVPTKQSKKVSSIARLWRSGPNNEDNYKTISVEGINGRLSNGRISNGGTLSPDRGSAKGGFLPSDLLGYWSSPESRNHHLRGIKGCIPLGVQKNSLKSRLLEARFDNQKVQLRHVLKQKI